MYSPEENPQSSVSKRHTELEVILNLAFLKAEIKYKTSDGGIY